MKSLKYCIAILLISVFPADTRAQYAPRISIIPQPSEVIEQPGVFQIRI